MIKPRKASSSASLLSDDPYIYSQTIPADHILRRIKERVDFSFLHELVAPLYATGQGRPALTAELMGKVAFLQFYYKLSDREVEVACAERLSFKLFLDMGVEEAAPFDASSLSRLRARWGEATFQQFFEATVRQAQQSGLLGKQRNIDSSKTLMNAAVLKATQLLTRVTERLLKQLREVLPEARMEELLKEDVALREDTSWWLSPELKEAHYQRWGSQAQVLLEATQEYLATPEGASPPRQIAVLAAVLAKHLDDTAAEAKLKATLRQGAKPRRAPDKLVSHVDPEARRAARANGHVLAGYKSHVSVDQDSGIVTALAVTPMNVEDGSQLLPLVNDEIKRGLEIEAVAADSAYSDGAVRADLQERAHPIQAHIPEPKPKASKGGQYVARQFHYDAAKGAVTCPAGHTVVGGRERPNRQGFMFNFPKATCAGCPLQARCLSAREVKAGVRHGRAVYINQFRALHDAAREHQETPEHKAAMKRRLAVEPKQAEMLNQHGMRRARYRGLSKVRVQAYLIGAVVNVKRLMKLDQAPAQAQVCLVT